MQFPNPIQQGRLVRRYKRFLADVELDGVVTTVHCANSGSMKGLTEPGSAVLVSDSENPDRKLRMTLEAVRVGRTWVGVNTMRPNAVVAWAVQRGAIPELAGYEHMRSEVKYGKNSRIDLLLYDGSREEPENKCFVEVKNTTLHGDEDRTLVLFPDAVTERGRKHLDELVREKRSGNRAVMVFFVNRADSTVFRPADDIDPEYGKALRKAQKKGVEIIPVQARVTSRGFRILGTLPFEL